MKKYIHLFIVVLYPYSILAFFVLLFGHGNIVLGFILDKLFQGIIFIPLAIPIHFYIASFFVVIINIVIAKAKKWSAIELIRINLIIKCILIPAYIVMFILSLGMTLTIFTIPFSIALLFVCCAEMFLTGLIAVTALWRARDEKLINGIESVTYIFLSFMFFIDIIIAIMMLKRANYSKNIEAERNVIHYNNPHINSST